MAVKADKIWLDGELVDFEKATVHVLTHTLHYGFGVFEGIRAYRRADGESHVFRLEEHVRRLFDSAHIIGMEIPFSRGDLIEACVSTLQANGLVEGYLRGVVEMHGGRVDDVACHQVFMNGYPFHLLEMRWWIPARPVRQRRAPSGPHVRKVA